MVNKILLGSSSPRRKEILDYFSIPYEQVSPPFDESLVLYRGDPASFAVEVAQRKCLCLRDLHPNRTIVCADTVVALDNRLFLKPATLEEAAAMLAELEGKTHSVFTGVAVSASDILTGVEESRVTFHPLTSDQIRAYHASYFPLDKAGGYAIQRGGSVIVKQIEGCYHNVMGLPLTTLRRLLMEAGIDLWQYLKSL